MGGNDHRHPNEIPGRDYYHAYVELVEDIHSNWPNAGCSAFTSHFSGLWSYIARAREPGSEARCQYHPHPNEIPGRDYYHAYVELVEDIHSNWPNAIILLMVCPGCGRTLHVRESRGRRRGASTIPSGLLDGGVPGGRGGGRSGDHPDGR
jgi:hypothetical protein